MPDIAIRCMSCGSEISVSEVVDISKLKCRSCGGEFLRLNPVDESTKAAADKKKRPQLKTKQDEPTQEPLPQTESRPSNSSSNSILTNKMNDTKGLKEVNKESGKMYSSLTWKAWLVFIIVGAASAYLRYGGILSPAFLKEAPVYEALIFLVLHILITLKAFKDSVFQGVMCVLIPPYSIYYLFSNSDDFMLRAVIAGLIVGIGQDAGMIFQKWSISAIDIINKWIASGG